MWSDLLGEKLPTRAQHPGDLGPPRHDGVSTGDEVEGLARKGQSRAVVGGGHHVGTERPQAASSHADVRWPPLGRNHEVGERVKAAQDLTTTALDVEHGGRAPQP
jgi:hypothetical protein